MAQKIRVYLNNQLNKRFFGKTPEVKTEPGWPGITYVDFELSQFFDNCTTVLKKGLREEMEKDEGFVSASITTPVKITTDSNKGMLRNSKYDNDVGVTFDTSEMPYVATIWAPTIIRAIECLQKIDPPDQ